MRKLQLLSIFFVAILFASCGTGNKFASSFGKRKYTKGYYVDAPASIKMPEPKAITLPAVFHQPVVLTSQPSKQTTTPTISSKASVGLLQKNRTKTTTHSVYNRSAINQTITNSEITFVNKGNAPINKENLDDDKGEINFYAIIGFVISTTGVVLTFLSATLTPLCATLLIVGTIFCVYSLFIYRVYYSWLAMIGLSFTIILLALLLL